MTPTKNTRIAAAAGIAVALVAAGGAYAASKIHHASPDARGSGGTFVSAPAGYLRGGPGSGLRGGPGFHHGDGLATAAGYLGLTPQQLITQLQTGKTLAQIADATSGKSASGLIDALAAAEQKEHPNDSATDIRTRVTAFVNGTGFPGGGPGFHHGGGGDGFATVSDYLGLTTQQLLTQLQTGKTLAQIADATSGKSASGLIDTLVAAEQKEHPNDSATDIRTRVTAFVNGTGFDHGPPPGAAPPQQQQQMQPGTHL